MKLWFIEAFWWLGVWPSELHLLFLTSDSRTRTKIFEKKFIFAWDHMYKEKLTYVKENKIYS